VEECPKIGVDKERFRSWIQNHKREFIDVDNIDHGLGIGGGFPIAAGAGSSGASKKPSRRSEAPVLSGADRRPFRESPGMYAIPAMLLAVD
jgi:hypothetical protein